MFRYSCISRFYQLLEKYSEKEPFLINKASELAKLGEVINDNNVNNNNFNFDDFGFGDDNNEQPKEMNG